jgi:hypothetical protein
MSTMTTLERTRLDVALLGPEAQRALGTSVTRMMAARGLAPIPSPRDLLAVLYHLTLDDDPKLAAAARGSAGQLPELLMRSGLADPTQDARVLDFYAEGLASIGLLELIVKNPSAHPTTIVKLATSGPEHLCDRIADNEERLLANPEIIGALYCNRQARMSTVDRAVELAIRNGVTVSGISAWDELVQAYSGAARGSTGEMIEVDRAVDQMFRQAAALHQGSDGDAAVDAAAEVPITEEKKVEIWQLSVPMKIRLATLGNAFDRAVLIRDPKKMVSLAVIKSPGVTDGEANKYASNSGLSEEVITYIANKREWTKLYSVKMSLVNNPKCPLAIAMRLLPHLREKDVQAVARSKGVPSALATQARKLGTARASNKKG